MSGKTDFTVWNIEWPARSPVFYYFDCFLWGYLKERVYKHTHQTVTELKEAIGREVTSFGSEVTKAVKRRAQDCIQTGGHHLKKMYMITLANKKKYFFHNGLKLFIYSEAE